MADEETLGLVLEDHDSDYEIPDVVQCSKNRKILCNNKFDCTFFKVLT